MSNNNMWEELEQKITSVMQKTKIPGLSIAIIKDQNVIYSKGFGAKDISKNLPTSPDTLYGIGSCTKALTCLAIMQLAEKGKLSIDDPVKKHIPFKLGVEDKPVLIRHLMSHSSGIPDLGSASVLISRHAPTEETWVPFASKDDFYTFINGAKEEVADEPERRYFYFNSGFTLLGEIIESISGLKYEEYVTEFILKPLRMHRSTFLEEIFEKDEDKMTAYLAEEDKPIVKTHPFDQFIYAAGGLLSSVNEFTNFLFMLLNKGKFEDTQIINSKSLDEMFAIHINTPSVYWGRSGYGFGLAISEDFLGYKLISHGGSTGLSSAHFAFIPELNIGVVSAANVGNSPSALISQTVLSLLLDKNPEEVIPFFNIQRKMEQFSGEYVNYKGLNKIKVFIENGILIAEFKSGSNILKYTLIPEDLRISDNKFYFYSFGNKTPITFEIKDDGKINVYVERNCFHKIQ